MRGLPPLLGSPFTLLYFLRIAARTSHYSFEIESPFMRTTILAYVIAFMGLVTIAVGVWGLFNEGAARARLRYYAMAIATVSCH